MEHILEGNKSYWFINILGWTIFSFFTMGILIGVGDPYDVGAFQIFIDSIFSIPIMVFGSHFIRNRLNHHKIFERIDFKATGYVILYTIIAAVISYIITYLYFQIVYTMIGKGDVLDKVFEKKVLFIIIGLFNTWFYFVGWTIFYVVIKAVRELNRTRENQLQMANNLKELQLNNLKGQINPHFMFNSLNNIRGLMLEDVDRSRDMITRLSEVLRYSLTKSTEDAIPLHQEMEMVEHYINISKIQLEDRLQYHEEIDPSTEHIEIPPMIIQLLVENGIKHGISTLPNGGRLKVIVQKADSLLTIDVINSGELTIAKDSTKLGLSNLTKRLALLYGDEAEFRLYEENDQVIASIKIPLNET